MGLSLAVYGLLALSGGTLFWGKLPGSKRRPLRTLHLALGSSLVSLTLFLLAIGIVGTLGHFGSLGHSAHLGAGLVVVALVTTSAFSALGMVRARPWAKQVHLTAALLLLAGYGAVLVTGWQVVQKYLPH